MPSRSRERQLAKLAARRKAEQTSAQRRKRITAGIVGAVVGLAAVGVGVAFVLGGNDNDNPVASGSPAASATSSPSSAGLPTKTGTVTPQAEPAKEVACGGTRPADADTPKPQFDSAPTAKQVLKKDTTYTAVMETSCGTIEIELDSGNTPQTVASFVFLAEKGYFDGQFFHRVVDSIDVIQGGDPLGNGQGGPGYSIPDELTGHENYTPGTVAMANAGSGTGGSQFFIITGPDGTNLNGNPNYTIFGRVVDGLDVAKTINALMPKGQKDYDGAPTQAVYIDKVTIDTAKAPSSSPSASPSS
jgi:peptidyl-prolyl cis-trans isomerase B (cyclophilin B)